MKPIIPQLHERESRFLSGKIELRAAAETEGPKKIFGYAATFGNESSVLESRQGKFVEIIDAGAFDDVLNDDIRALFNHDPNMILARSKGGTGTLSLGTDSTGLWYTFDMPQTRAGDDLLESIRRGDVESSSFGFSVAKDQWAETRDDAGNRSLVRTITKVAKLYDVSPVVSPAYPDATVALRSLEEFRKQEPEPTLEPKTPSQEELTEVSDWAARLGI